MVARATSGDEVTFRCIDGRHVFCERRDARAPLVLRQSAWCAEHDSPAVATSEPQSAPAANLQG